jgi:peptidoglycan L-alanyl-D-glutamate endopeptidase CwlK
MYSFGKTSLANLTHVHPTLVELATFAIGISTQDFSIAEGCRTLAEEKKHVADGTSKTLNSMHIIQSDGFGHAVDLVPYVDGKLDWDWNHIYPIVQAVRAAADHFGIAPKIRWGGCWDKRLDRIDVSSVTSVANEVHMYSVRHKGPDLLDGPHFELPL